MYNLLKWRIVKIYCFYRVTKCKTSNFNKSLKMFDRGKNLTEVVLYIVLKIYEGHCINIVS